MSDEKIEISDNFKILFRYLDSKIGAAQQESQLLLYQRQINMQATLQEHNIGEGEWTTDGDYNLIKVEPNLSEVCCENGKCKKNI